MYRPFDRDRAARGAAERQVRLGDPALGRSYNQHQVTAVADFIWNIGPYSLVGSLRAALQRYDPYPMLAYDHAGGQVLSGLRHRREAEVRLFLTPAPKPCTGGCLKRERERRLQADYRARRSLNSVLARYDCLHGYRGFSRDHQRKCTVWRHRHGIVSRDIARLHRLGIR